MITSRSIVAPRTRIEANAATLANWFDRTPSQINSACDLASWRHIAASLLAAFTLVFSDLGSTCKAFCDALLSGLSRRFTGLALQHQVWRCSRVAESRKYASRRRLSRSQANRRFSIATIAKQQFQVNLRIQTRIPPQNNTAAVVDSRAGGNPEYRAVRSVGSAFWSSCQQCQSHSVKTTMIKISEIAAVRGVAVTRQLFSREVYSHCRRMCCCGGC